MGNAETLKFQSHFDVKIEDLEDDSVRIERPTPKYPDTRRTSAPAILWSASSFVSDQVNFRFLF